MFSHCAWKIFYNILTRSINFRYYNLQQIRIGEIQSNEIGAVGLFLAVRVVEVGTHGHFVERSETNIALDDLGSSQRNQVLVGHLFQLAGSLAQGLSFQNELNFVFGGDFVPHVFDVFRDHAYVDDAITVIVLVQHNLVTNCVHANRFGTILAQEFIFAGDKVGASHDVGFLSQVRRGD